MTVSRWECFAPTRHQPRQSIAKPTIRFHRARRPIVSVRPRRRLLLQLRQAREPVLFLHLPFPRSAITQVLLRVGLQQRRIWPLRRVLDGLGQTSEFRLDVGQHGGQRLLLGL